METLATDTTPSTSHRDWTPTVATPSRGAGEPSRRASGPAMTHTVADMVVDLLRSLKMARDEACAFSELLNLSLGQQHALQVKAQRDADRIAQLCEENRTLRGQVAPARKATAA